MLQDILPKKYDNNYYPDKTPDEKALCLIFKDSYVLTAHEKCEGTRDIPEESASSLEKDVPAGAVIFTTFLSSLRLKNSWLNTAICSP